jgi:hypothetical protein
VTRPVGYKPHFYLIFSNKTTGAFQIVAVRLRSLSLASPNVVSRLRWNNRARQFEIHPSQTVNSFLRRCFIIAINPVRD